MGRWLPFQRGQLTVRIGTSSVRRFAGIRWRAVLACTSLRMPGAMTATDVSEHTEVQPTPAHDAAWRPTSIASRRRWLLQINEREVRLIEGEQEMRNLVREGLVGLDTPVYEVGLGPWTAADIPDLARMVDEEAPRSAPVATRNVEMTARTKLNSELSILDHPLAEHEIEYYDETPPSRWPRWGRGAGIALVAAAVACWGGYRLVAARFPAETARALQLRDHVAQILTAPAAPSSGAAPTSAAALAAPSIPAAAIPPAVEQERPPQETAPAAAASTDEHRPASVRAPSRAHAKHRKHRAHRR